MESDSNESRFSINEKVWEVAESHTLQNRVIGDQKWCIGVKTREVPLRQAARHVQNEKLRSKQPHQTMEKKKAGKINTASPHRNRISQRDLRKEKFDPLKGKKKCETLWATASIEK